MLCSAGFVGSRISLRLMPDPGRDAALMPVHLSVDFLTQRSIRD